MTLLIASSIAFVYQRYVLAAVGFLAVGFGGSAVAWSHWSQGAGHHNSFEAFLHPKSLSYDDAFLLVTHAPFMLVGAAILIWRLRQLNRQAKHTPAQNRSDNQQTA
jgi:hypothetical protein